MTTKLNSKQYEAVQHKDGPCLVIACPGSGKTLLLTERVAELIEKGVDPSNIFCITFTNKAASEMRERIARRLGVDKPGGFIGTFHGLCVMILRQFAKHVGYKSNFTIIDQKEQKDFISKVARQMGYDFKSNDTDNVTYIINTWRENLETSEELNDRCYKDMYEKVARQYLDKIKSNNIIDFSGILYECAKLLDHEEVLLRLQNKCQYIQVDEFQDSNYIQLYIIGKIGDKYKNIMGAGDPEQSIYRFRNARIKNVHDFIKKYNPKIINVDINYRSTPEIIKKAHQLIINNKSHMVENITTPNDSGTDVRCINFENQLIESEWISNYIKKLISQGGWKYSDIAILYRINSLSQPIETSLRGEAIPYKVVGGKSFYDRMEIRDCVAMMKFAANPYDGVAFHRICKMIPGFGNITVGNIENISEKNGVDLIQAIEIFLKTNNSVKVRLGCEKIINTYKAVNRAENPAVIMKDILNKLCYDNFLQKKCQNEEYENRKMNVSEFVNSAAIAYEKNEIRLDKFLQNILLMTSQDNEDGTDDGVSLLTIHAAKGLEFPIVIIVGNEKDLLPHSLSISEFGADGLEEERRLCYVAMTRAKVGLFMTYCNYRKIFTGKRVELKKRLPSQFLFELGF